MNPNIFLVSTVLNKPKYYYYIGDRLDIYEKTKTHTQT